MSRSAAALFAALSAALLGAPLAFAANLTEPVGLVEARLPGSEEWIKVTGRISLPMGAEVRTARGSKVHLLTDDGATIELGPGTNFKLESAKSGSEAFSMLWGRVRAKVVSGLGRRLSIRTQTAVAAVRGTDFTVFADADGSTRVEVREGIVAAADLRGNSVDVHAGEFTEIPLGGGPSAPRPNPSGQEPMESRAPDARAAALREVWADISKESVLAQAQAEIQSAEYQNRKVAIDAFGARVRLEEYIARPTADSFKYVVLNTREDRFDFGKILFVFNTTLPEDLTLATKTMLTATGSTAPTWQLEELSSVMSNTFDKVVEEASGGRMIADDPGAPTTWTHFFGTYGVWVGDALSTANGGRGELLWTYTDNGDGVLQTGEFTFRGGTLPVSTLLEPDGGDVFHTIAKNVYSDGSWLQAEDFVSFDDGTIASAANFSSQLALGTAAERLNFERVYTSSFFSGRKIDLVFSAKLLKDAGLLRLD